MKTAKFPSTTKVTLLLYGIPKYDNPDKILKGPVGPFYYCSDGCCDNAIRECTKLERYEKGTKEVLQKDANHCDYCNDTPVEKMKDIVQGIIEEKKALGE